MNWVQVITLIGVGAILGAFIFIGKKLQILDNLDKTTQKIKCNLKILSDWLTKNTEFDPKELQAFSPLRLTTLGEKLINDVKFNEIFENNKQDFFNYINGETPKLKYDVEQAAIKSIFLLADKEYMNFLKVFLYNNPDRKMENIAPTFGVYVRDQYLAEHPEINQ